MTLSNTREQQSQIKRPIARPISLRQPKRIATRAHSYRTQEVQGREESREYNVDADGLRSPQRLHRHGATRSHRVPLPETMLPVLLDMPPSVTCAANSISVMCGRWREPPGLPARQQLDTTLVSGILAEYPGILAQYPRYWGGIVGGAAPLSHGYRTGSRTAGTRGNPRAQHRRRRTATTATPTWCHSLLRAPLLCAACPTCPAWPTCTAQW